MNERFVDAAGIRTRILEEGSGDAVVLIHGGGAGADAEGNWKTTIPLFSKERRVIAVDMVGFGKTDKPDPAAWPRLIARQQATTSVFMPVTPGTEVGAGTKAPER